MLRWSARLLRLRSLRLQRIRICLEIHKRAVFPRLRRQRQFTSGSQLACPDRVGVRFECFLFRLGCFLRFVSFDERGVFRSQRCRRQVDERELSGLFGHWNTWRKNAAECSEQECCGEMNQNRHQQSPQNCSRIVLAIAKRFWIAGLGEHDVSRCHQGSLLAVRKFRRRSFSA